MDPQKKEKMNDRKLMDHINREKKKGEKIYNPSGMYKIGQTIYHPVFKDTGRVVKKRPGAGDYRKIIVKFDNIGEKLLIEKMTVRKAKMGDTVLVHYTSRLEDGSIVDTTKGKKPLKLTLGENRLFPSVEDRIIGMIEGESQSITIPADEAYGRHRKNLVFVIDRKSLHVKEPKIGEYHKIRLRKGDIVEARFTKIGESKVTLDANHIFAGKDIIYEIEVLKIFD